MDATLALPAGHEARGGEGQCGKTIRADERLGIVVAEFLDSSVVNSLAIEYLDRELGELIDVGPARIAVDFGNVYQMSSQVISVLLHAHRRCAAAGGALKIFRVRPEVAPAFAITGVGRVIECHLDERSALESRWPPSQDPPAPVAIATAAEHRGGLARRGDGSVAVPDPPAPSCAWLAPRPPGRGDGDGARRDPFALAVAAPTPRPDPAAPPSQGNGVTPLPPPARSPARIRLIPLVGRAKGRVVAIQQPRFLIGRDPCCHLRSKSPTIGLIHAILEERGGRVYVRDLGSAQITRLNERFLYGEEAMASDGDQLQVGPLRFTVAIGPAAPHDDRADRQADGPPDSIWCPRCGAVGWVPLDGLVHQLARAPGGASAPAPPPPPAPAAPPPDPEDSDSLMEECDNIIALMLSPFESPENLPEGAIPDDPSRFTYYDFNIMR